MCFALLLLAILTPTSLAINGGLHVTLDSYFKDHKFFVTVLHNSKPLCSGIAYDINKILTSAYCVYVTKQNLTIQYALDATETGIWKVESITMHPNFNIKTFENDIAILRVNTDAQNPISKLDLACGVSLQPPTMTYALGVGVEYTGGPLLTLPKKIEVRKVPSDKCKKIYQHIREVTDGTSCYDEGICSGDQGGPVVVYGKEDGQGAADKNYLLGVASWSRGCGEIGYPSVFTNICKYVDFI